MKKKSPRKVLTGQEKQRLNYKTVIHPNRWLIWAIIYVIFLGSALVSYIKISEIVRGDF